MDRPGLRDLVSFDHLVTPRIAAVAFWVAQVANASIWVLILRSAYKQLDYGDAISWGTSVTGATETAPDYSVPAETIQWDNIWICIVLFVLGAVLIRVLLDFTLVQFRRLDTERGILGSLSGGSVAAAGTAPPRPLATSPAPPWEAPAAGPHAGPSGQAPSPPPPTAPG